MGLLSNMARGMRAGGRSMATEAPLMGMAAGGLGGAGVGAAMNPDDPMAGAMMGGAVGAGLGGGQALGRVAGSAMDGTNVAQRVAEQIRSAARAPGQAEAMIEQLRARDPQLASDVLMILMGEPRRPGVRY